MIAKALLLTFIAWLLLVFIAIQSLPFGEANPLSPSDWIDGNNKATDLRDYYWAWSFSLGALLVSLTLVNALRRTRIMETQAGTDLSRARIAEEELQASISSKRNELNTATFARSVEMLSSTELTTRVGAVYSLEELMRSQFSEIDASDRIIFGRQIGDTLASFVRSRGSIPGPAAILSNDESYEDQRESNTQIDVAAAFLALVRSYPPNFRPSIYKTGGIDLGYSNLRGISLPAGSHLSNMSFIGTDLTRTNLRSAIIEFCDFREASLESSYILNSKIFDSSFEMADFEETSLNRCEIIACDFTGSRMYSAYLDQIKIDSCNWARVQTLRLHIDGAVIVDIDPHEDNKSRNLSQAQLSDCEWLTAPIIPARLHLK